MTKDLKSYQTIDFLKTGDSEIIPCLLSYNREILKSYQAIYLLMTKDHAIILGNILSYDRGS